MRPRIPRAVGYLQGQPGSLKSSSKPACLICRSHADRNCVSTAPKRPRATRFVPNVTARFQSNTAVQEASKPIKPKEAIAELKQTLFDLQKNFQSYVNLSRIQLALRGLEQHPGNEIIRIAVVGAAELGQKLSKVRRVVRLLVADPLKEEEEWERELLATDGRPLLLRIGQEEAKNDVPHTGFSNTLLREVNVSSPPLNSHRLEILVTDSDIFSDDTEVNNIAESMLVPKIDIPTSSTGRYTPISTPVHRALLVGESIMGAASLLRLPSTLDRDMVMSAVDLHGFVPEEKVDLPFQIIDVALAEKALHSFRESLDNAMSYEHDWFSSGMPTLVDWLKAGSFEMPEADKMKPPIKALVSSVLEDANQRIHTKEAEQLAASLSAKVSAPTLDMSRERLQLWAERAHTELRDQLDVAFEGQRWRKLSWWKLFWRVDDVSMITVDILNQRFLPESEKEIIYLSGQLDGAGVFKDIVESRRTFADKTVPQLGSLPAPPTFSDLLDRQEDSASLSVTPQPWPLHIPTTRAYLAMQTVPALQALAQRLMMQTLTTSALSSALGGLVYMSTLTTGFYEAGAVATFGIVWSLSRFQKKWEAARKFWEGEVREEGRKSVRAVEGVVGDILSPPMSRSIEGGEEREEARRMVEKAREMLDIATKPTAN